MSSQIFFSATLCIRFYVFPYFCVSGRTTPLTHHAQHPVQFSVITLLRPTSVRRFRSPGKGGDQDEASNYFYAFLHFCISRCPHHLQARTGQGRAGKQVDAVASVKPYFWFYASKSPPRVQQTFRRTFTRRYLQNQPLKMLNQDEDLNLTLSKTKL